LTKFEKAYDSLDPQVKQEVQKMSFVELYMKNSGLKLSRKRELLDMSFMQMLQQPEFKSNLIRMELNQEQTFEVFIKRVYPKQKEEWKVLFYSFWIDFLAGKSDSMRDWVKTQDFYDKEAEDKDDEERLVL